MSVVENAGLFADVDADTLAQVLDRYRPSTGKWSRRWSLSRSSRSAMSSPPRSSRVGRPRPRSSSVGLEESFALLAAGFSALLALRRPDAAD